jgi:hypothetical protein
MRDVGGKYCDTIPPFALKTEENYENFRKNS